MANFLRELLLYCRSKCQQTKKPRNGLEQPNDPQTLEDYRLADDYHHIHHLAESTEGTLGILRCDRTGKLVVAKHTKAREVLSGGLRGTVYAYPNEAKILLKTLKGARDCLNVVQLFGAERSCLEPGRHFLFIEFCSGGDLLDQIGHFTLMSPEGYGASPKHLLLRKERRPGPADTAEGAPPSPVFAGGRCLVPEMFILHVFSGLVQALAFIHEHSAEHEAVIHGDIKPDNVFLRWGARNECGMPDIVLADFGAAQLAEKTAGITGTPGYDSPEVANVAKLEDTMAPQDFAWYRKHEGRIMSTKSDVYQLGHLMYFMTSLRRWTTGTDPATLTLPEEYTTEHCRHLATTIAWCLAVRPTDRPSADRDLLPVVGTFEERRDGVFGRRGSLPSACWRKSMI